MAYTNISGVDRCSMLEEQELNVSKWVRCEEGIGKGKRKKGKELKRRLDITVRPLGECLQNLITLNVITLLDLWMDISLPLCRTLSIILSLSLSHSHSPTCSSCHCSHYYRFLEKWQGTWIKRSKVKLHITFTKPSNHQVPCLKGNKIWDHYMNV